MTSNDQPSPTPTPPPSAPVSTLTSVSSPTSPGRSWRNPLTDAGRFTLNIGPRPIPTLRRTKRGELNLAALTHQWVVWRRIECGGADMGGAHELNPKGPNQTFTAKQVFAHRQRFAYIPRPCEAEFALGFDRPGRHAHPLEHTGYQISLAARQIADMGLF